MKITKTTHTYNHRRFSKPWIAKVDFSDLKGNYAWGQWTGDHYNGGDGILSIDANPGDIIATGQKDHRQPRNSAPDFFVVTPTGGLDPLGDKGAAYKYYLDHRDASPDAKELQAERIGLIARIAEIDALLNTQ